MSRLGGRYVQILVAAGGRTRQLVLALATALLLVLALASVAQARIGIVSKFGGEGTEQGKFSGSWDAAAYGATGDFYVADVFNGRVQRFDRDGNFERAFGWGVADGAEEFEICTSSCQAGVTGGGAGQFAGEGPSAIAVGQGDGSVYVVDSGNFRVEKFDSDGNFERAFGWGVADGAEEFEVCTSSCQTGIPGSGGGQLGPWNFYASIAVDPTSGNVLVTDLENARVQEFEADGAWVRAFGNDVVSGGEEGFEVCTVASECKAGLGGEGPEDFGWSGPNAVAVDASGAIYTGNFLSSGRMQKLVPAGGGFTRTPFGTGVFDGSGSPGPGSVDIDHEGHVLVAANNGLLYEFDSEGNLLDTLLEGTGVENLRAVAFDPASSRGFLTTFESSVYVLDDVPDPEATMGSVTNVSLAGATLHGTVNPHGGPPSTAYHFEYRLEGGEWERAEAHDTQLPSDAEDHEVSFELAPPAGLEPNSTYEVRLVAQKSPNPAVFSEPVSFQTGGDKPIAATVGTPFRTAETAELQARINPRNAETTYHFEFGQTTSYGSSVPAGEADAGSGGRSVLVTQSVEGLQPGSTYHYRVVASNESGTTVGADRTVTTRGSDDPLTHGHLPGPPDSDRNWELVSLPDTSGNSVLMGYAFSDDGNRAVYQVAGGTPISETGTAVSQFFAERTPSGWEGRSIWPGRGAAEGRIWTLPAGRSDLSKLFAQNLNSGPVSAWAIGPDQAPSKVYDIPGSQATPSSSFFMAANDASRMVVLMKNSPDPAHPVESRNLYDITSGEAHIVSLLPNGQPPSCGVPHEGQSIYLPGKSLRVTNWISADGSRVFFPTQGDECEGPTRLYMRDLPGESTVEISGPAISGPDCSPAFIKSTAGDAYFWSQSRLVAADTDPDDCGISTVGSLDGDVYRYSFANEGLDCLTCGTGTDADVYVTQSAVGAVSNIMVAADGSRLYFTSPHRLTVGDGSEGASNIYRLDVGSGDLSYVAPALEGKVGEYGKAGEAATADGSVVVFPGSSEELNALSDSDNGGLTQFYRYEDEAGSLVCVSCPRHGAATTAVDPESMVNEDQVGPNSSPIDAVGDLVFKTPTPLVSADQNSAGSGQDPTVGTDIYEWRDGQQLLITDGTTSWGTLVFAQPGVAGITPSGQDIYFTATAQFTPDALDSYKRLYDARLGGGFEFPAPPPPCDLETCQGEAPPPPGEAAPSSDEVVGPGNLAPRQRAHHRKHRCTRKARHGKRRCARHHSKKTNKTGRAH